MTDAIPGMIAYWDKELCCRFANKAYAAWHGQQPGDIIGRSLQSVLGENLYSLKENFIKGALAGQRQGFQRDLPRADGTIRRIWINYVPHLDNRGVVRGCFVLINDVTPLREAERRIQESETRYRLLAEHGTDMVFELDRDLVRRYVSPACREILGYQPNELIGVKPRNQVHPDDAARVAQIFGSLLDGRLNHGSVTNRIRHRDGRWVWVEATLRALRDPRTGSPSGIIGSLRDVSARKTIESELEEAHRRLEGLATIDALTGLANRRSFDDVLEKEYRRAKRDRKPLSLIMIDVDHFKAFNDHYGHPEGDECLRRVSAVIRWASRRPGDLAARYGGEEFAVILPNTNEFAAAAIADEIRATILAMDLPHQGVPNNRVAISCGVAAADVFEGDPESLVKLADAALYRAKASGRDAVVRASKATPAIAAKTFAGA